MMNVARIQDGVVINIEVADEAWIDWANTQDWGVTFVPFEDAVKIGDRYQKGKFIPNS
jgi:hypothetical protein